VEFIGVNITFPVGKRTGVLNEFTGTLVPNGKTVEKRPVNGL
jgi:hypothetical protein